MAAAATNAPGCTLRVDASGWRVEFAALPPSQWLAGLAAAMGTVGR
jgi:hypothetical protein